MTALKGKQLNGVEEADPKERAIKAIELLIELEQLFIMDWKVEKIENTKVSRRTPVYFANNKEMFQSLFEKRKAGTPILSMKDLKRNLKGEISVILRAITPYYDMKEGENAPPVHHSDERINRAYGFLEWLEKYDPCGKHDKEISFESLFQDPENAIKVKAFFESRGYTSEGQWIGLSGKKLELLAAYHAIKSSLKPGYLAPQVKIFYKEFGLKVGTGGYVTDRHLRTYPDANDQKEFVHILS